MKFKPLLSVPVCLSLIVGLSSPAFAKKNKNDNSKIEVAEEVTAVEVPEPVVIEISDPADIKASYCRSAQSDSVVRAAIVLADMSGNRDTEFLRGFLMGTQEITIPEGTLSLKVINGQIPADSLNKVLGEFNPNVIFSTHEKETPKALLNYSQGNFTKLINVFDAKGEEYKTTPGVYQLLSPSVPFNLNTARYLMDLYSDNILLLVEDPDESDLILREMFMAWPEDRIVLTTKSELPKLALSEGENYLIYPSLASDKDIVLLLQDVQKKVKDNPLTGIRVIGRPNWIAVSKLDKQYQNVEVLVPAKCYFDETAPGSKRFLVNYNKEYDHYPIKSYPVYSAMGYDAAKYLIPVFIGEMTGTVGEWTPEDMLQSYFSFGDDSWGNGTYNKGTYILHYTPGKEMKKDLVN